MSALSYLQNILGMKCPRCGKGKLFKYKMLEFKGVTVMVDHCEVCGQRTLLEPGFYFGTGYVSYALTIALSVASFIAWWVIIGFSLSDNRIFYWLITTIMLIVLLQPWIMRLSRVIWLSWFYHKDDPLHAGKKTDA